MVDVFLLLLLRMLMLRTEMSDVVESPKTGWTPTQLHVTVLAKRE